GFVHLDCAYSYGNEKDVGDVLEQFFKDAKLKREELFISSKLWSSFHAKDDVIKACQESISNLKVDYLDLYILHWPITIASGHNNLFCSDDVKLGYNRERIAECWRAMEDLVEKGLVKAIGTSNISITKMERLLQTARIIPAVNQVECHAYLQQEKLVQYGRSKGIAVAAYRSLGIPNPGMEMPVLLEDPVVCHIAQKHFVTPAQVLLAFGIASGLATCSHKNQE
ncbi:Aldo-keto reductase family 1 member B10, partial [Geodia barretti]